MRVVRALAILLVLPLPAAAHGGVEHGVPTGWIAMPLLAAAGLYALGVLRRGRLPVTRALAGLAGFGALALATLPPLAAWSHASFLAHMVEHELIMVVAAPLLVLARPLGPWLRASPRQLRLGIGRVLAAPALRGSWRLLAAPATASALQVGVLWGWHVPPLFQAALRDPVLHAVQHLSFLGAACLFWWAILARGQAGYGVAALHLFAASVFGGLLGALFLFAPRPWFPAQAMGSPLGLSPVEDQQLAGLVMAGAACLVYPAAALALLERWIAGRREARRVHATV
jgi:cytochrome c oxidase assembly factor CtaG